MAIIILGFQGEKDGASCLLVYALYNYMQNLPPSLLLCVSCTEYTQQQSDSFHQLQVEPLTPTPHYSERGGLYATIPVYNDIQLARRNYILLLNNNRQGVQT